MRNFRLLCELRSFSKAAKKVHKSQAALSTQIARFEEQAEVKFFDRSQRPLKLSEAGDVVLKFSLEFLNKLDQLDRFLKELSSGVTGEVKIAGSTSIGTYLLPSLVAQILKMSPRLKIAIAVQQRHQVCQSVRLADQDFGIILAHNPPDGLISKPLRKEPLYFVISAAHPLANRHKVTVKELRSVPFIGGEKGNEWHEMLNRTLKEKGIFNLPESFRVNNYQARKEAVRAGLGVAILARLSVERELREKTLCKLNVVNCRLETTMLLVERKQHRLSPAVAAVKTYLEEKLSNRAE